MKKMKVRLVEDHKTGKCWFEEAIQDQWHRIECTVMSCEGNARSRLSEEVERRRQQELLINRTYRLPFEIDLFTREGLNDGSDN